MLFRSRPSSCRRWRPRQKIRSARRTYTAPDTAARGRRRTKGGQLIVENGVSLTDRLISRIKFYAIPQVSVTEDPIPATKKEEQVEVPSHVVKPEAQAPSYSQKVVCSKEFQNFQISYSRVIATYRTVLED